MSSCNVCVSDTMGDTNLDMDQLRNAEFKEAFDEFDTVAEVKVLSTHCITMFRMVVAPYLLKSCLVF